MSSQDHDSQLAGWLPQLEAYRAAIDAAPIAVSACSTMEHPIATIDNQPSPTDVLALPATSDVAILPAPQIVHLPIDGILKRIKKTASFVLGIGTVGDSDPSLVRSVVSDIVARCCRKTDRNAILITVRPPDDLQSGDSSGNGLYCEARWSYFGGKKTETKAWHSQLAELPRWKQKFGLIVFDLGDVSFPMMPQIGRLCDGIVVQMLDPSNSRATIQALKSLQRDRLTILGAWSVELNSRDLAA